MLRSTHATTHPCHRSSNVFQLSSLAKLLKLVDILLGATNLDSSLGTFTYKENILGLNFLLVSIKISLSWRCSRVVGMLTITKPGSQKTYFR